MEESVCSDCMQQLFNGEIHDKAFCNNIQTTQLGVWLKDNLKYHHNQNL